MPRRSATGSCTDVHAAVDLHGVGVDDLAVEALGQVEREVCLARRGGADHGHDRALGARFRLSGTWLVWQGDRTDPRGRAPGPLGTDTPPGEHAGELPDRADAGARPAEQEENAETSLDEPSDDAGGQ